MTIFKAGIDYGGHWAKEVTVFAKEMGMDRVIATRGRLNVGKEEVIFPRKANDNGIYLATISTDPAKQVVQERLRLSGAYPDTDGSLPTAGLMHFPHPVPDCSRYALFTRSLYNEFTSEVRILSPTGHPSWKQEGKNEGFDTLVGNLAMIRICQLPQFGIELDDAADVEWKSQQDEEAEFYARWEAEIDAQN